jgi:hypothetical protein
MTGFGLLTGYIGLLDTSSAQLLGSGFQQPTLRFLWVPKLSPASGTNFSDQQLATFEPQRLSN